MKILLKLWLQIMITVFWELGLLHVPDWDNRKNVFAYKESNDDEQIKTVDLPKVEKVTLNRGGTPEPGKLQQKITLAVKRDGDGMGWEYKRFTGAHLTPDFTEWNHIDDEVCNSRGFSMTDRSNYTLVRPYILERFSNKEIAEKLSKSISWVEKYAAAGRQMISKRLETYEDSPTVESW